MATQERLSRTQEKQSNLTVFGILAASFCIGVNSVWVMHFINTSAVRHGVKVEYNLAETLLSLVFILLCAFVGISIAACHKDGLLGPPKASTYHLTRLRMPAPGASIVQHLSFMLEQVQDAVGWRLALGGTILGAGVGAMHYTGVNAIRANLELYMDPVWMLTSVPIAAVGGMAIIWLMFHMHGFVKRCIAAVILGIAVSFVHFYAYFAGTYSALPRDRWDPDAFAKEVLVEAEPAVVAATLLSSVFRFLFLGIISAGAE